LNGGLPRLSISPLRDLEDCMVTRFSNHLINTLLAGIVMAALNVGSVHAQADPCGVKREVGAMALDELTWKQLNLIYEDVSEGQFDVASADLQKMLKRAGRDSYLQAIINQALAQVEWSRENYVDALGYFEKAVELDSLPDSAHFALMYQIAQLYYMQERFDEALEKLGLWFCESPAERITPAAFVLQASIHARKEDYAGVLDAIDKAIAMDEDSKESWHQLKLSAHYELEQFPQAADTLEVMIARWPDKKTYWIQLSQIYYKLKQDERALAVLALAYRKNLLDQQSDLVYLSSLYSNAGVPYRAAEILERGIRDGIVESSKQHWAEVADTWYSAEELEKALLAYGEAGKAASDGVIDLRRGFILVDLERWLAALETLNLALQKGGLDDRNTGEAYLLRGMTQFNLGNFEGASADWDHAGRYDKTREAARQWLNHLREERRRSAP
jgi:tetratricopeptide (TPR) repeat protein